MFLRENLAWKADKNKVGPSNKEKSSLFRITRKSKKQVCAGSDELLSALTFLKEHFHILFTATEKGNEQQWFYQ